MWPPPEAGTRQTGAGLLGGHLDPTLAHRVHDGLRPIVDSGMGGTGYLGPLATVPGCTWYVRLLLKGTIAGVIVGPRSLSETSDPRRP